MTTKFVQDGDTLEYTNGGGATIPAGTPVVVGQQIGIAHDDIAVGATGVLHMSGVFTVPKVATAVIGKGEAVIWDASASAFEDNAHTPAAGDVSGCCVAHDAAGNGTTSVPIRLNVGIGTVT